jgi:uncharacterized protein (DUF2164 family)
MASIELSPEQRRGAIAAIQRYFEDERDEPIGELGAMLFLDFLADEIGEIFYNRGVDDAQALLRRQWSALDDELEVIKLPERHPPSAAPDEDEEEETAE